MAREEESKTSITDQGTYCYQVMPFDLKNTGATYQKLAKKILIPQLAVIWKFT